MPKRFPYYARLSEGDKRIYRKSDAILMVKVPDANALRPLVEALESTLQEGKRTKVARSVVALTDALFRQLGAPKVKIRVREVRPDIGGAELYGQYTFATEETVPMIEVWMRTLAHERVVKFKTFLRTLLHEVAHHLDATVLELKESFHTQGFFRRESSLVRQLLATADEPFDGEKKASSRRPATTRVSKASPANQLQLFADDGHAPSAKKRRAAN